MFGYRQSSCFIVGGSVFDIVASGMQGRTVFPGVPGVCLKLYGKSVRPLGKTTV